MDETIGYPESLTGAHFHYCPGCTHGVIHRMVAEVLDELGVRERTVGVAPVVAPCWPITTSTVTWSSSPRPRSGRGHGRQARATQPDHLHLPGRRRFGLDWRQRDSACANRGEKITVIFVNNAIYGMTGGQMAPTTLPGQIATTCPMGRDVNVHGWPMRMVELLSSLRTPAYLTRVAVHKPEHIVDAKKAIRQAFRYQMEGRCFSLVELLSLCPTNWGMSQEESVRWLGENMIPYYPSA